MVPSQEVTVQLAGFFLKDTDNRRCRLFFRQPRFPVERKRSVVSTYIKLAFSPCQRFPPRLPIRLFRLRVRSLFSQHKAATTELSTPPDSASTMVAHLTRIQLHLVVTKFVMFQFASALQVSNTKDFTASLMASTSPVNCSFLLQRLVVGSHYGESLRKSQVTRRHPVNHILYAVDDDAFHIRRLPVRR